MNASHRKKDTAMTLTLDKPLSPLSARAEGLPARQLLSHMALSREGDRREGILLRQGKGWFQVSGMGHESLAALVYALRDDDYLFPYYRDRAMSLARGITNYDLALAYLAKDGSSSLGVKCRAISPPARTTCFQWRRRPHPNVFLRAAQRGRFRWERPVK